MSTDLTHVQIRGIGRTDLDTLATFSKFALVGASGVVVNLGIFVLLLKSGLNKHVASIVAVEVAIVSNFVLNNFWTFSRRMTRARTHVKGARFNMVSLLSLTVSYTTFVCGLWTIPHMDPRVAQLIGILPATLMNYFLNSWWTFRPDGFDCKG